MRIIAPVVINTDPAGAFFGGPDVTMHVWGHGFDEDSVIVFNGEDEPTVCVSNHELTTVVKPSLATVELTVPIQVRNGDVHSGTVGFLFIDRAKYEASQAKRRK